MINSCRTQIKREKELFYNCDEKYAPGHKCKTKFFLLMGEDDDQDSRMVQGEEPVTEDIDSNLTIFPEVSMHALAGQLS